MPRKSTPATCKLCERKYYALGFCYLHYCRNREGRPLEGPVRSTNNIVGYRAAHSRVDAIRGKARTYFCVDCTSQASEWSLKADAKTVHVSDAANSLGKVYSLNVRDYEPRCTKCHREHDGVDFSAIGHRGGRPVGRKND